MSFRPAHAAKLVLFAMLANLFLAVAPAQLPLALAVRADPSIGKTGHVLPTIGERLGLNDKELPEPSFTAPDPQQETGPELPDGTYRLPPNYVENPDYFPPQLLANAEAMAKMTAQIPLGRLGKAQELGAAVCFLCSDGAGFITGHVLPHAGGWA